MGHVDTLAAHFDHPGVFEHTPGRGAAGRFFLEAGMNVSLYFFLFSSFLSPFAQINAHSKEVVRTSIQ